MHHHPTEHHEHVTCGDDSADGYDVPVLLFDQILALLANGETATARERLTTLQARAEEGNAPGRRGDGGDHYCHFQGTVKVTVTETAGQIEYFEWDCPWCGTSHEGEEDHTYDDAP